MALDTAAAVAKLRDITVTFDREVRAYQPMYPEFCRVRPSSRRDEKYAWLGGLKGMREWLGDRIFNEIRAANYTLENKPWEDGFKIERFDIDDDILGMYGEPAAELGQVAAEHPDELLFDLIVAGETTACWDGQYFFDTDHSWGSSGSQSNSLTYNAADHTAVTAAEFKAAFQAAIMAHVNFVNDHGRKFVGPTLRSLDSFALVVPTQLYTAANEALNAVYNASGASNVLISRPSVLMAPYLTSGVKFYLFNTSRRLRPFVFQARQPLMRQIKGLDDREFKDVKFMVDARYNVGYLAWWNAVLTTFN